MFFYFAYLIASVTATELYNICRDEVPDSFLSHLVGKVRINYSLSIRFSLVHVKYIFNWTFNTISEVSY